MDFVQGLPMYANKHNSILVVVENLTKVAHFILGNLTVGASVIPHKFFQEVFILKKVIENDTSNRDAHMMSRF